VSESAATCIPSIITKQDDPVLRQPNLPRRLTSDVQTRRLRDQPLGACRLELKGKLVHRVQRVRRRHDAPGPEHAQRHGRCVDAIGRVKGHGVALSPAPLRLQTPAKCDGCLADLAKGVASTCLAIREDLCADTPHPLSVHTTSGFCPNLMEEGYRLSPLSSGTILSLRSKSRPQTSTSGMTTSRNGDL
jgi:hypothetical protein